MATDKHEQDCRTFMQEHACEIMRGKEGFEYWKEFGEVRHVFAFLL